MKLLRNSATKTATLVLVCLALFAGCSSDSMTDTVDSADMPSNAEVSDSAASTMVEQASPDNTSVTTTPTTTPTPTTMSVPEAPAAALPTIENIALIFIAEETGPTSLAVTAGASFYAMATPLVSAPVLKSMNMLDSCEVGSESSQINADALNVPIEHLVEATGNEVLQVTAISAGDTIELSSAEGSFVSLVKNTVSNSIDYAFDAGATLSIAVPDSLTTDIAGDDFPAMTGAWVTPQRLGIEFRGEVRSLSTDAMLTWSAATKVESVQSRIHVYAGFIDELTGETKSYQCELADDGEFILPADVQALYANGVQANFVDVARYTISVELVNGISLVQVFLQRF